MYEAFKRMNLLKSVRNCGLKKKPIYQECNLLSIIATVVERVGHFAAKIISDNDVSE